MKKFITLIFTAVLLVSCTDYDSQFDQVDAKIKELAAANASLEAELAAMAALNASVSAQTAAKLADTTVTAGTYGDAQNISKITVDAQGRITSAEEVEVDKMQFNLSGDTGSELVKDNERVIFEGGNGISFNVEDKLDNYSGTDSVMTATLVDGIVSASAFSSPSQGTVRATLNGVQTDVDSGLQTNDSPTFAGLTINGNSVVTGDLTVQGTTTTLSTTNTAIKDKFILLNSGSANPDQGGLVIDEGSGTGHAFIYDEGDGRFGINQSVSSTDTSANAEAYVALVVDENNTDHDISDSEYAKRGNMKVDSSDDIYIYV